MEKKIALDIDGVLTENVYIPPEERTCERYQQLKPNLSVVELLDKLAVNPKWNKQSSIFWQNNIVYISSRNCDNPSECFRKWLFKNKLWRFDLAPKHFGILKEDKAKLAEQLGCAILIDDSMEAIAGCDDTIVKGILLNNYRYNWVGYSNFVKDHPDQWVCRENHLEDLVRGYFKSAGIDV